MRKKLQSEPGKQKYKKRKITVEPVFGNLKYNLGFREFSLRGHDKVCGEFNLMSIAHNLKKIHDYRLNQSIEIKIIPKCDIVNIERLPYLSANLPQNFKEMIAPRQVAAVAKRMNPYPYPKSLNNLILNGSAMVNADI